MTRVLMVASDAMEFRGILEWARGERVAGVAVDWVRRAVVGESEWWLAANGVGGRRAGAAVDAVLAKFAADALVSLGSCGAVVAELGLGEILVATEVAGERGSFRADVPPGAKAGWRGLVRTIDHIARTAQEKAEWRVRGASAVEMEAAAVAERAAGLGLPFYCVKAVTDLAGEDLANDWNAALRSDGHFDTIRILGSILRQPEVRLPEVFRLRRRSIQAAHALGEFFADCRF